MTRRRSESSPVVRGVWMGVGSAIGTVAAFLVLGLLLDRAAGERRDDSAALVTGAGAGGCWP